MKNTTLRVIQNGQLLYESDKRWLMPLFDLEKYLAAHPIDFSGVELHDKVIGKAAALLMIRLGTGSVHGDVMSVLASDILERNAIPHTYNTLVDRIDCQTEELLLEIDDPEAAYQILAERAHRSTG
jgi:hypothetical protein